MRHTTITLIGMPGAGKSTVGVLLAKQVGLNFVDTDLLIQVREEQALQQIMDSRGHQVLRSIEQEVLLEMPLRQMLVATGGSAVYGEAGMLRLKNAGPVVYLNVPVEILNERIGSADQRGIARSPGQSFTDIYRERCPLYEQYADYTIAAYGSSADAIASLVAAELGY